MSEGLLHALLIAPGSTARRLDWREVRAWQPQQGLLWLHLDVDSPHAKQWAAHDGEMPGLMADALFASETRPRTTTVGDGALVTLRGVNLNPGADPEDMVSIRLWVEANRIVSSRRRRLLSVDDVVQTIDEQAIPGTGRLVALLIDRLVNRIGDVIDDLEERVAEVERAALDSSGPRTRAELAELRREAIALRRYLAPQREALARLHAEPLTWLDAADRLALREVTDRLVRHVEDLDAVRERAAVVQEEVASNLAERLNRRMYVLSVVAAVFLPLGFLTGLLGVNVGGIPGSEFPGAFAIFVGMLVAIVAVQLWYFRKKDWF